MKKLVFLSSMLFLTSAHAAALNYSYSVPYSGAGSITISNLSDAPVTITALDFITNANITATPYGTLWGWQSTLSTKPAADGVNTEYSVTENPAVMIAPHQSASITYAVDAKKSGGPFSPYNTAMNPTSVTVTINSKQENVSIKDRCTGAACTDPGHGKRIMGYYPNWAYWRTPKFTAEKIPYQKVNNVVYAFSIFDSNGAISLYDQDSDAVNLPIISQARQQYPYLNASLSFGGWSWASTPPGWHCQTGASPSGPAACFSQMAADKVAAQNFINNAVKAMKEVNFNGIDIDWEYPTVQDADNYAALLSGLRMALDAQGKKDNTHYYLTIAVGAGVDKIKRLNKEQWAQIASSVDYIDVMTYDFHGAWDQNSDFMAAMKLDPQKDPSTKDAILGKYNVTDAMQIYLDMGIAAKQLVVGVPMYGRMMSIEKAGDTNGLYQKITGTPVGEWDNQQSGFTGMLGYNCIADRTTCGNSYRLPELTLVDPKTTALGSYALTPWGFSNTLFVTYEDEKSAAYKANWIKEKGFAGAMLWDFTGDFDAKDPRSIVNAIQKTFNQ